MQAKKVFVVKNFKSPYIEQAIFILREDTPSAAALPDAVSEAERIITGYLQGLDCPQKAPKKSHKKWPLAIIGCLAFVGLIYFLF